jgi:hypothetical protein
MTHRSGESVIITSILMLYALYLVASYSRLLWLAFARQTGWEKLTLNGPVGSISRADSSTTFWGYVAWYGFVAYLGAMGAGCIIYFWLL